jgi:hypothetical protein
VGTNGACFVRSLSLLLYGNEESHLYIRNLVADHMQADMHLYIGGDESEEEFAARIAELREVCGFG